MDAKRAEIVDEIVINAWQKVIRDVECNKSPMSSEKTMVFNFLLNLIRSCPDPDLIKCDFEFRAYDDLPGEDKSLDLLVYCKDDFKVAFEFKYPRKTTRGHSNQTQTRLNIYRDISRLYYLVGNGISNIKIGYFLCAVNEMAYCNPGDYAEFPNCKTHQGYSHSGGNLDYENHLYDLPNGMSFVWSGVEKKEGKYKLKDQKQFAWLAPIKVIDSGATSLGLHETNA